MHYYYPTTSQNIAACSKVITLLAAIIIFSFMMSCTSNSGPHNYIEEKVVIVEKYENAYKIKRLAKGVVDYIPRYKDFEVGDTILTNFRRN